ncbi:unnamed protein product, partial [Amoebophrya sp. A25]|eukprot:GSA25T00004079001.1
MIGIRKFPGRRLATRSLVMAAMRWYNWLLVLLVPVIGKTIPERSEDEIGYLIKAEGETTGTVVDTYYKYNKNYVVYTRTNTGPGEAVPEVPPGGSVSYQKAHDKEKRTSTKPTSHGHNDDAKPTDGHDSVYAKPTDGHNVDGADDPDLDFGQQLSSSTSSSSSSSSKLNITTPLEQGGLVVKNGVVVDDGTVAEEIPSGAQSSTTYHPKNQQVGEQEQHDQEQHELEHEQLLPVQVQHASSPLMEVVGAKDSSPLTVDADEQTFPPSLSAIEQDMIEIEMMASTSVPHEDDTIFTNAGAENENDTGTSTSQRFYSGTNNAAEKENDTGGTWSASSINSNDPSPASELQLNSQNKQRSYNLRGTAKLQHLQSQVDEQVLKTTDETTRWKTSSFFGFEYGFLATSDDAASGKDKNSNSLPCCNIDDNDESQQGILFVRDDRKAGNLRGSGGTRRQQRRTTRRARRNTDTAGSAAGAKASSAAAVEEGQSETSAKRK